MLQFHYTKWPDYGTPKLAAPLLNFLKAVRASNPKDVGPIIVHCRLDRVLWFTVVYYRDILWYTVVYCSMFDILSVYIYS